MIAIARIASALLIAASLPHCGRSESALAGSNVILIVVDALRADHLGAYGYPLDTSPFLDELARRAVLFETAVTASSQTVPSVISLWSAVYPNRHGNQYFPRTNSFRVAKPNVRPRIANSLALMAEHFQRAGYATAAAVANPWMAPGYGFARGFDDYRFLHEFSADEVAYARGSLVNAVAKEVFARWRDRRFFLYLHYMDVHAPYDPPARDRERFAGSLPGHNVYEPGPAPDASSTDVTFTRALYDAEIRGLDDRVRELYEELRAAGLESSTLVVFTSDHGDEFHEHRGLGHGWTLYEEVIRAPLLFVHPALAGSARRIGAPVSAVDVLPTLLALVGEEVPPGLDGVSLAPGIVDRRLEIHTGERFFLSELGDATAIRRGDHKLVRSSRRGGSDEAFDLGADAGEREPLAERPPWRAELEAALAQVPRAPDDPTAVPVDLRSSPEERALDAQLRALGYVGE